jgi:hypothetical protein
MATIPFRRLLSRLTALALTTSSVGVASAADLDAELTIDVKPECSNQAATELGRGLALALEKMAPLGATHVLATWALAPDPTRRLAVATALEWKFRVIGDSIAIDHLSRDDNPQIRVAAARAAWARRATGGDTGVLARLADDPDPEVRAVAVSAR